MKTRNIITALILLPLCTFAQGKKQKQPNIVFIFIDDLGWGDVGCYGNDFIDTPNIDQLARDGMRFTDFYAAGAVCSPTRCAVQSGQNQARIGITAHIPGHWRPFERVINPQTTMALPLDVVTVAESMKEAGYTTGYVGKWHLGRGDKYGPSKQGYDFAAEINGPHLPGRFRATDPKITKPRPDQFRTDYESELCESFIQENKDQPFFLMLSPFAVHIPLGSKSGLVEKYSKRAEEKNRNLPHPVYAGLVEEVDDQVGRIIAELEKQNLTKNTMVVFTSDNGGLIKRYDYQEETDDIVSDLAPLKGEKGSLHEGGIRVPLIVKYPGVVNAGTTCSEPAISYDFYPTFVEAGKGKLPTNQTIDGLNILPLFQNPKVKLNRKAIHWHYPHYHHDRPASAIRERDWKLIEYLDGSGDIELYHIAQDLSESKNLANEKKGKVGDLKQKLIAWRNDVLARIPVSNPSYDPERAPEWWSRRTGKLIDSSARKRFPTTEKDL
jgi:uncharacterized sulfatase